jgi:hypothetical protein
MGGPLISAPPGILPKALAACQPCARACAQRGVRWRDIRLYIPANTIAGALARGGIRGNSSHRHERRSAHLILVLASWAQLTHPLYMGMQAPFFKLNLQSNQWLERCHGVFS